MNRGVMARNKKDAQNPILEKYVHKKLNYYDEYKFELYDELF